jgi:hypothetical protein
MEAGELVFWQGVEKLSKNRVDAAFALSTLSENWRS